MQILYRDDAILVCVKPCGVSSSESPGGMPELLRKETGLGAIYTVHRLDKTVSGLMVYALTAAAAASLSRQITDGSFHKEYLAVTEGRPVPESGRMDDLLLHIARENKTYTVSRMRKGVREASLLYSLSDSRDGLCLVRIRLLTGRTHQIRAQFSSRKLPLFGDRKYGAQHTAAGPALWSCRLEFLHPRTGKSLCFELDKKEPYPWTLFADSTENEKPACGISPEMSAGTGL